MATPLTKTYQGLLAGLWLQAVAKTGAYSADSGAIPDTLIATNFTSAAIITAPVPTLGRVWGVKDIKGNANTQNVTIHKNGSETFDGAASYVLNLAYAGVIFACLDGANWSVVASYNGTVI
jgi:hypothetical protein